MSDTLNVVAVRGTVVPYADAKGAIFFGRFVGYRKIATKDTTARVAHQMGGGRAYALTGKPETVPNTHYYRRNIAQGALDLARPAGKKETK